VTEAVRHTLFAIGTDTKALARRRPETLDRSVLCAPTLGGVHKLASINEGPDRGIVEDREKKNTGPSR
jgi:hypothetical protein